MSLDNIKLIREMQAVILNVRALALWPDVCNQYNYYYCYNHCLVFINSILAVTWVLSVAIVSDLIFICQI